MITSAKLTMNQPIKALSATKRFDGKNGAAEAILASSTVFSDGNSQFRFNGN